MTKEVNVRHVFTQTKKEGGGPPFFVLVTDESIYLATCRCSDRLHLLRWILLRKSKCQTRFHPLSVTSMGQ